MSSLLNKIIKFLKQAIGIDSVPKIVAEAPTNMRIITQKDHNITREKISPNALKVLYRLNKSKFSAYIVGGGVRDCLLGHEPKDFDIATNASPEQVRRLFRNCRLIGKRFRLAHIYFKNEIIEVATFRKDDTESEASARAETGIILRDNVYGSLEDDIWRRDFTINALYYNIADFSVLDYTGGMEDLKNGIIKIIGDPKKRYQEDPVRMLRAIRFAAKLGFVIDKHTEEPITECKQLLYQISNARLFDECLKLFLKGASSHTYTLLRQHQLFGCLFPETEKCLSNTEWHQISHSFLFKLFENTDDRIDNNKTVSPAFIFAALLWLPIQVSQQALVAKGIPINQAFEDAMNQVINDQIKVTAIPKRIIANIREIWNMQNALENYYSKRSFKLIHNLRFRAGYDFLCLRVNAEPNLLPVTQWWDTFINSSEKTRKKMCRQKKVNEDAGDI